MDVTWAPQPTGHHAFPSPGHHNHDKQVQTQETREAPDSLPKNLKWGPTTTALKGDTQTSLGPAPPS